MHTQYVDYQTNLYDSPLIRTHAHDRMRRAESASSQRFSQFLYDTPLIVPDGFGLVEGYGFVR